MKTIRQTLAAVLGAALLAVPATAQAYPAPTNAEIAQWVQESLVRDALRRYPLTQQQRFAQFAIRGDLVIAREAMLTVASKLGSNLTGSMVSCVDGVVTLRGRVETVEHRDQATAVVEAIAGVVAVHNLMTVPGEPVPADPGPVARREDPPVLLGPFGFLTDDQLGGADIRVLVDDGFVTVTGEVSNVAAQRHVGAVVRGVPGVRVISNKVQVRSGSNEDDRRLELIIYKSLEWTRELWDIYPAVGVQVRDGVALLVGTVRTEDERLLVEDVAASVRTIVAVDNRLTVDPLFVVDPRRFRPSDGPSTTIRPDSLPSWGR